MAAGGIALFVAAVREAGLDEIADGVRRIGWGLTLVLALGGARFVLRTASWRLCMPPGTRLPFPRAFSAFLAGDALGSVTPLGLMASEPLKAFLVRHHLATGESVASLALDNVIYAGSVVLMIAAGLIVMLLTVPLPLAWRELAVAALAAGLLGSALAMRLLRRGAWREGRGPRPRWRQRLADVRARALEFSAGHPIRLWRVFLLHMLFHVLAVVEVFLTLGWLLGRAPSWGEAVMFSALDRVLTAGFKFVPFRAGIDEASSGALAPLLGMPLAAGVTLAVVRKIRNLSWALVGMLLIAAHPAPAVPAPDFRETGHAPRP